METTNAAKMVKQLKQMEQNNRRNGARKWNNNGHQQLENETTIMYHINKTMNNNNWNNKRTNGTSK